MEPLRHHPGQGGFTASNYIPSQEQLRKSIKEARATPRSSRLLIRVITLGVAISLIGTLGHSSIVWFQTRNVISNTANGSRQRAWPAHMDLWPTWVMLGAAVMSICISVLALLSLCGPVQRLRETNFHTWIVFFTSLLGIAGWVAAAVYFKLQDTKGKADWTLWSWACTHEDLSNGKMSFKKMCIEMQYSFYASTVVAALELISLVIFGWILVKTRKGAGYSHIEASKI
ncbi:hypothetical protein LTR10_013606 [Elasticomyces elasticus]|uniref:MARVEL domain-containing protein n=1 Tax=Exophiala sideris TaxID=1016849 RepID=A0ABR0JQE8_9EURO|nr:hypothetical protein LTR10_013606 [Elasticomyces elasticus]KAK5039745.1 hypothetical protein LTS07_000240 [Exophiala sideris]KAK5041297.1 hypothetical protein LTR13_002772 [Exophiala sideris]KAK5068123.1 hypothetical protein LTR69_000241 [Exophiala sideris]KAK5187424.1 hypothetical protein LTR44_000240 [Eurotiomycetes sp. CCFEE 6388]